MLDFARWTWTVSLAALVLALLFTRRFRSLPLFSVYLLATATQAAMHWRNMDMQGTWWINWAVALSVFRLAAVAEIFWLRAAWMHRRILWFAALCGISGGVTYAAGRVRPDSRWIEAAMVFRHFETGLLVALLLGIWVTYLWGSVVKDYLTTHSWLMVLLIASRVAGSIWYEHLPPNFADADWGRIQAWTYLGATACYAGWITLPVKYGWTSRPAVR